MNSSSRSKESKGRPQKA